MRTNKQKKKRAFVSYEDESANKTHRERTLSNNNKKRK